MAQLTADDWALAALTALGEGGVAGVRVEALARTLGVTKGSYYHHFTNRRAVLERALSMWRRVATEQVILQIDAGSGDPRARLSALAEQVFLRTTGGPDRVESAVRAWAAADPEVARVVARVDERRLDYVRQLLEDAGLSQARLRSELFYRALIGEFTWRGHGGPALSAEAVALLVEMVLGGGDAAGGAERASVAQRPADG